MVFLTFLVIPLLVCLIAWTISDKITWQEVVAQLFIQFVFIGLMSIMMLNSNMSDVETWNGFITEKKSERVSCTHSFKCFCYTSCHKSCSGSGKSRSCRQVCQEHCKTCYEHDFDQEWYALNNLGEKWEINTVDRQGRKEPKRWTEIVLGEPTSSLHSYENYIKGSPDSLFHATNFSEEIVKDLPEYPNKVFDYWKMSRVVQIGTNLPDIKSWEKDLGGLAGDLGSKKQVNILLVFVQNKPQDFFYLLERYWLGGKKNDVIVVIGLNLFSKISWVDVMSISNEEFKVFLRNDLLSLDSLEREQVLRKIKENVEKKYVRRPMKDFAYLKEAIKPTTKQWYFGLILGWLLSLGLSVFFYFFDPFGDVTKSRLRKKILWR